MHRGKYVFNQIMSFVPRYLFDRCVEKFQGDHRIRVLSCWQQFLVMAFGQLGKRESLRDICVCFEAHQGKLYHLGFTGNIRRITLRDANENRNYRIHEDFAHVLIAKARKLYIDEKEFDLELSGVA